jgi:hypothetical protein
VPCIRAKTETEPCEAVNKAARGSVMRGGLRDEENGHKIISKRFTSSLSRTKDLPFSHFTTFRPLLTQINNNRALSEHYQREDALALQNLTLRLGDSSVTD